MKLKKILLVLAIVSPILFVVQSCKKMEDSKNKEDKIEYRTVDVAINANETYTYSMPQGTSDDAFRITTPASHSKISTLENNATTYRYIPATDYTGSDKVVISTVEEQNSSQHSGGGNCSQNNQHESETQLVITINLNIKDVSTK